VKIKKGSSAGGRKLSGRICGCPSETRSEKKRKEKKNEKDRRTRQREKRPSLRRESVQFTFGDHDAV
jgi:hypothetical protein